MSISLELSAIQFNSLQSAIINTQVDEFLRRGGQISSTAPAQPAPRPYGRVAPAVASVRRAKSLAAEPRRTAKQPNKNASAYPPELIESVRAMAAEMTQAQVSEKTGMTATQLYSLAGRNGFTFVQAENPGVSNLIHNSIDERRDLQNVERIKSFMALGINRRQAAKHMGISTCYFSRLIADYSIDYPKCEPGSRKKAVSA
jgi:hypothetical protein